MENERTYTAFAGQRRIASGELRALVRDTKATLDRGESAPLLIFEDQSGRQVDFDFRGTSDEVLARLASHPLVAASAAPARTGPGRPRLGVVCREVSLLPRHWEWLERQSGGISAALRRLVDEARKRDPEGERVREAREAAARFMWAMGGDLPGFEEASRALFAGDSARLSGLIRDWPEDVRRHTEHLLAGAVPSSARDATVP